MTLPRIADDSWDSIPFHSRPSCARLEVHHGALCHLYRFVWLGRQGRFFQDVLGSPSDVHWFESLRSRVVPLLGFKSAHVIMRFYIIQPVVPFIGNMVVFLGWYP